MARPIKAGTSFVAVTTENTKQTEGQNYTEKDNNERQTKQTQC